MLLEVGHEKQTYNAYIYLTPNTSSPTRGKRRCSDEDDAQSPAMKRPLNDVQKKDVKSSSDVDYVWNKPVDYMTYKPCSGLARVWFRSENKIIYNCTMFRRTYCIDRFSKTYNRRIIDIVTLGP